MDGYAQPSPVRMPGRLKWALGFAYFQVVANLAVGILIGSSISDAVSHGEELASPGIAYFSEYFSYIVAAAILLAAIVVTSGYTWGRTLLVVCEALAIIQRCHLADRWHAERPARRRARYRGDLHAVLPRRAVLVRGQGGTARRSQSRYISHGF